MILSKFLLYTSLGCVAFIAAAEVYHQAALALKDRLQLDDELNEIIFTRDPINYSMRLTRHISFAREKTMHVMEILENVITSARKSVHVAMYIFTSEPLATALIEAHKKGVDVLVIIDHSMEHSSNSKITRLRDAGIPVRIYRRQTLHHKMCVVDVPCKESKATPIKISLRTVPIPLQGVVISGSLNWTREALMSNEENFSVNSKPALCQRAAKKFFELWNDPESLS